jgi:hypothetical protein
MLEFRTNRLAARFWDGHLCLTNRYSASGFGRLEGEVHCKILYGNRILLEPPCEYLSSGNDRQEQSRVQIEIDGYTAYMTCKEIPAVRIL